MFQRAFQLVLSPTDLASFLACRHRTGLDLAVARGELAPPVWRDPLGQAFRDRGLAHERAYVTWLRGHGLEVLDLADAPEGEREALTLAALRAGVPAVAQGVLAGDGWRGYADVLVRVDAPSVLGAWSYEVHDTKLARETRGGTVLQLAVYSDLLGELQGRVPERFHVVAPGSPFDIHAYRLNDFAAFVRRVRGALLRVLPGGAASLHDAHYPEPVEACGLCRWAQRCDERRRADDHLSFIAGIGRWHRAELVAQGHGTLTAAAAMPLPIAFTPKRGSRDTYVRLREQARVQHQQRTSGTPVHELLLPVTPDLGLARLPEPSPGDVFLDLEGARFARDGGREYLFGAVVNLGPERGLTPIPGGPRKGSDPYRGWWAHDDFEERAAFETVIDTVMQAWAAHPGLHVYHFGHYEPSTFKRLMGRHATRGDELDRLLRAERFVDLHAVVRQALRAGVESYSIKQLEQFYGFARAVPLDDATAQMQLIELALEGHAPEAIPAETRAAVQAYNEDDCRSTAALRDWLERLRAQLVAEGTEVPRPQPKAAEPPAAVSDLEAAELAASARLLEGLPPEASQPQHPQHPRWLMAQLLGWHRREDKAQWWERYRLNDLADEDLIEEGAALVGLEFVERVDTVLNARTGRPTGSVIDRYRYPPQECELRSSGDLFTTGPKKFGDVVALDRDDRLIDVKKGRAAADVHPMTVFQSTVIGADGLRRSLLRQCADVDAPTCGGDLLFRRPPRLTTGRFEPLVYESPNDFAIRLATTLDRTTLPVQGPPGSGKTCLGALMIRALVKQGRKVGVVAVSHKVIRNLLDAVRTQASGCGELVRIGQRVRNDDEDAQDEHIVPFVANDTARAALTHGEIDVMGGTAWLWADEEFAGAVDVLFVDEAGQMSLANALAVSPAAGSLVLLGDPQQLEQPQKASHPDGVDISALQHVLGDRQTMPPERGLFLPVTWRLAPAVCAFTSELFYEGKLHPREGLEQQRLVGTGEFDGAGLWWVPVPHDGNRNWSAEEVDAVEALVDRLLTPGTQWVDGDGATRPLGPQDLRVVAPYNAHVNRIAERLGTSFVPTVPGTERRLVPVGTVDRFQGQEAAVVIYAMGTSLPDDAPRGLEFLYSLNRLNVATSRARCAVFVVASPRLLEPECRTPRQMQLANALCRYVEMARVVAVRV
jgi:predicted RecB family nuclease